MYHLAKALGYEAFRFLRFVATDVHGIVLALWVILNLGGASGSSGGGLVFSLGGLGRYTGKFSRVVWIVFLGPPGLYGLSCIVARKAGFYLAGFFAGGKGNNPPFSSTNP